MTRMSRDRITVDMRGLKAALVQRARQQRVAVSVVVREAVTRSLDVSATRGEGVESAVSRSGPNARVLKISLRMTRDEAGRLDAAARQAGLSRTAFLVGLLDGVRILSSGGRSEHLAALIASNENVSTLSRNINHLVRLLGESSVRAAQAYREMLETLNDDVRRHLSLASSALAELRPSATMSHARVAPIAKEK
jgi:hypothetical protein